MEKFLGIERTWSSDMLEPITTNFEKLKETLTIENFTRGGACSNINRMRGVKTCSDISCNECREWLAKPYEEKILDEVEKKYLSAVIKPFRNKVRFICKESDKEGEFIRIAIIDDASMFFPYFKKKTIYKGMNPDVPYTLEELGL